MKPVERKPVVVFLMDRFGFSERRACALAQISRTGFRHQAKGYGDEQLRSRLKELASKYSRYGYLMLHAFLKQEGLVVNRKRTYRVYTEEKLQVRTKKRKKLTTPRVVSSPATAPNQSWSMDFTYNILGKYNFFKLSFCSAHFLTVSSP